MKTTPLSSALTGVRYRTRLLFMAWLCLFVASVSAQQEAAPAAQSRAASSALAKRRWSYLWSEVVTPHAQCPITKKTPRTSMHKSRRIVV